ncbi:uncharacterized protein NECHADRAFT_86631 [Fusarium vanettenii 77-13-4]|uniref:Heterokaryon incompatibility domain-containing protein n=1 Tax=Fusarium vanettenii (strain ATCC MYA-4622 / CBS 123669 / FGSC 9596 / NRRL 45880 / 77-13-4) TaxID=660122 RepID=C7ZG17_FUSV7|nr:uncharacterized protein NECHADRAFT_86631 [Fusarium vanettenii 77-13-4]EEU36980.1 hypothetical protein NECHADRAFT_86631 [Fusarium vanettenii 77-13-4]
MPYSVICILLVSLDSRFRKKAKQYRLHTCQHCETFIVDTAKAEASKNRETNLGLFHIPGAQIFKATSDDCALFQPCVVTLEKDLIPRTLVKVVNEDVARQFTLVVTIWYIRRADGSHEMTIEGAWRRNGPPESWLSMGVTRFSLWPHKDASCGNKFTSHAVQPTVSSEKAFTNMQTSLDECLSSHAECTRTSLPPPSRLVDVQNLRLVDSAPIGSPTWAALSYCWGGPQKAQTTSQNVKNRYQSIDFDDMPLTLRDSIRTCRELNLPYLWIDSICIIQDDENDKAREINKMPEVYQGALITLSASCATTCHGGFLHDRLHPAPGVALPIRGPEGDYNIIQAVKWKGPVDEPIDTRAWTFQEQALSERIIDYGSQRASYFCNSSGKKHRFGTLPSPTDDLLRVEWANTVAKYSARQLTFASDRLNAVAAVASRFAEAAGLSSSDILEAEVKVGNALLPFGSVASSRITINGPLVHTTLKLSSGEARFRHDGGGEHSVELFLDKEEKIKAKSMSVWLLELLFHLGPENSMGPGSDTRFGLILKSTGQGQFTRIGIYSEWIPQDIPVANHKPRNDMCKRCKEISGTAVSKVELV